MKSGIHEVYYVRQETSILPGTHLSGITMEWMTYEYLQKNHIKDS